MSTTLDLDRLATAFLTRAAEPAHAPTGQAMALLGAHGSLSMLPGNRYDLFDAEQEAERMAGWENRGIRFVTRADEAWPRQLADLGSEGPYGLWYRGDLGTLEALGTERSVAIVGARAATSYGDHIAREWAADLAADHLVVSGGAYGIDGAVHRGAMASSGRTVIVSAGGVHRPYPAGHNQLFENVWNGRGLVLSEVAPDSTPTKWRFLARNRLIAAFTPASILVEAGFRSGSLNTASNAEHLGRRVGAVPGPITSATSTGTNELIRTNRAQLVAQPDDVRKLTEGWLQ